MVHWCGPFIFKVCVSVHELTWDKRSEIGRRSWFCDLEKNGWDRDQRSVPPPPMLCYCVLLEPKRKPAIWLWEGERFLLDPGSWQFSGRENGFIHFHQIPFPWPCLVTVLQPGWARRYIPHQGPKDHLTPKWEKKFQILAWPVDHFSLLSLGWPHSLIWCRNSDAVTELV